MYAMKIFGGLEAQRHSFLNSVLVGVNGYKRRGWAGSKARLDAPAKTHDSLSSAENRTGAWTSEWGYVRGTSSYRTSKEDVT